MRVNRGATQGSVQVAPRFVKLQGASGAARVALSAVALATILLVTATPSLTHANGGATEIFRGQQGLYELVVAVQPDQPAVGIIHLSFAPREAADSSPVTDAEITVIARQDIGETAYQARALNSPDSPSFYEANITFLFPGMWTLQVDIQSDRLGAAVVVVPLEVTERPLGPSAAGGLVLLGAILVVLVGATFVWYSARRQRQD